MRTAWEDGEEKKQVLAPLSLIVSSFAPVQDARRTLTPQLRLDAGETDLLLIDLGAGKNRLGGSALAQVFNATDSVAPDVDQPDLLPAFFSAIQALAAENLLLAYHDRSDGGLFVSVAEMVFAARCGVTLDLGTLCDGSSAGITQTLFAEELGAVLQIRRAERERVMRLLGEAGLGEHSMLIGSPETTNELRIAYQGKVVFCEKRVDLHRAWSETTFHMQSLRDSPECALQEYDRILDDTDEGLSVSLSFDPAFDIATPDRKSTRLNSSH